MQVRILGGMRLRPARAALAFFLTANPAWKMMGGSRASKNTCWKQQNGPMSSTAAAGWLGT